MKDYLHATREEVGNLLGMAQLMRLLGPEQLRAFEFFFYSTDWLAWDANSGYMDRVSDAHISLYLKGMKVLKGFQVAIEKSQGPREAKLAKMKEIQERRERKEWLEYCKKYTADLDSRMAAQLQQKRSCVL